MNLPSQAHQISKDHAAGMKDPRSLTATCVIGIFRLLLTGIGPQDRAGVVR